MHDRFVVPLPQQPRDGGRLYELGPVPDYRDYPHLQGFLISDPGIMAPAMAGKLKAGATGIAGAAVGLVRHLIWLVSYRLEGNAAARDDDSRPRGS
jgi:hypothetical protein